MSFFKKRSTAIGVFVVVVVLFSLIGCHLSLGRACRKAEDAFFDRSLLREAGAYSCPGDHLENCVSLANRLLSVVGSGNAPYAEAYEQLRTARLALIDALDSRDIPAIGQANQALAEAVEAVKAVKASGAALSDSHDDYDVILADFDGAQAALDDSGYNDYILAFREKTLDRFPTGLLRRLAFVDPPATFP